MVGGGEEWQKALSSAPWPGKRLFCIWGVGSGGEGGECGWPTPASMSPTPSHPGPSLPWCASPLNTNTIFPPTQSLTNRGKDPQSKEQVVSGLESSKHCPEPSPWAKTTSVLLTYHLMCVSCDP